MLRNIISERANKKVVDVGLLANSGRMELIKVCVKFYDINIINEYLIYQYFLLFLYSAEDIHLFSVLITTNKISFLQLKN